MGKRDDDAEKEAKKLAKAAEKVIRVLWCPEMQRHCDVFLFRVVAPR